MISTRFADAATVRARPIERYGRAPLQLIVVLWLALFGLACGRDTSGLDTGALTVTISGLPAGIDAAVTVTGPKGFTRTLAATETLTDLAGGSYTVAAASVSAAGATYAALESSQTVNVSSGSPATAVVAYAVATGRLTVTISGLPPGAEAAVTVSGPDGFSQAVTATRTLTDLVPGSYTVTAADVSAGGTTYSPVTRSQEVSITSTASAARTVAYEPAGSAPLNLTIDGLYVTQSSQTYTRGVPLVAGRNGVLRVFVKANRDNLAAPAVRVRFYLGGALVDTAVIAPPGPVVPTTVNEGTLASSWNVAVPGSLIQPSLAIVAEVDAENVVAEGDEEDNRFPLSGSPQQFTVQAVPPLSIRFVPIRQSVTGLTGNVSESNKENYLAFMRRIFPISSYDADVRATYTTDAPELQSGNENQAWGTVLSELQALQTADGSARYYYGVVRPRYTSGIAGIGYVGGVTALGWDRYQVGEIAAHELGHNFGRQHSPCGNPGGVDPEYPYAQGRIGVYGFDVSANTVKPKTDTDIMGYCDRQWISDYTYVGIFNVLVASASASAAAGAAAAVLRAEQVQPTLLVWGRIRDGRPVLEPAFTVTTRPVLPSRPGPYRIDGLEANGRSIFSISFAAHDVADTPHSERHFAFAIPLGAQQEAQLATLRLLAGAEQVVVGRRSRPALPGDVDARLGTASVRSVAPGQVAVSWDGAAHPMALVRDARTGEILSFARGGSATVWTDRDELEIVLSDGVRSQARRVPVRR